MSTERVHCGTVYNNTCTSWHSPQQNARKLLSKKVVPSIRGGFMVHMYIVQNESNFKLKPTKSR